jgi:hypothetical protein
MTNGIEFLSGSAWEHLTGALLHTLWQGLLAAGVLYLFLKATPARRADLRYGAAVVSLAVIVLGGFLTWAILEYKPSIVAAEPTATGSEVGQVGNLSNGTHDGHMAVGQVGNLSYPNTPGTWTVWAAHVWLIGVLLMLVRAIVQVVGAGRLRRMCRPASDTLVLSVVEQLRATLRIARRIRVAVGEHIVVPAVLGVLWPTVLLPALVLTGAPPELLRAILAHELAHIRRHDYLVNLAQMLVEALLFFNPAVWWVSRQIRIEREACCDALAVAAGGGSGGDYARALAQAAAGLHLSLAGLQVAQTLFDPRPGGGLLDRIKRILAPAHRPRLHVPWYSLAALLLVWASALTGLWAGATATVAVAEKILSPAELISRLAAIKESQPEPAGPRGQDYPLETQGIAIAGVVAMEDGLPVPSDVEVAASSLRPGYTAGHSLTLAGNRFAGRVNYGKVYLHAYVKGWAPTFAGPLEAPPGGKIENTRLVLRRGFDGRVKVIAENGAAVAGVRLKGRYDHPCGWIPENEWTTGADGIATIAHCAELPLELDATADGYQDDRRKLSLRAGAETPWTLRRAKPTQGVIVSRATGKPIPDAEVRLLGVAGLQPITESPEQAKTVARTDRDGRFVLNRLRDDSTYTFFVTAPGFSREFLRDVRAGQTGLQLSLGPAISVRGRIIGPLDQLETRGKEKGICFSNPYTVGNTSHSSGQWQPVVLRDGAASFELRDLFPGTVQISAGPKRVSLDLPQAAENVVIDLTPESPPVAQAPTTRTIVLRLDLPPNAPMPRGELTATYLTGGLSGPSQESKRLPIESGATIFTVSLPNKVGYRTDGLIGYWIKESWGDDVPAGKEPFTITIPAVPAGAIFGQVSEADGSPARSAFIGVVVARRSPLMPEGALGVRVKDFAGSDGDVVGKFFAGPLPLGGTYLIVLNRRESFAVSPPVEVSETSPIREIELQFAEGVTVSGQMLTPDGDPAPGIPFRFQYSTPYSYSFGGSEQRTDRDGRFVFEHVNPAVPGDYAIAISAIPGIRAARIPIRFDGRPMTVRLERGRAVSGVVVDDATSRPVAGVEVYALPYEWPDGSEPDGFLNADAKTNERGEFRFTTMAARQYSLNTRGGRLAPASEGTRVTGGQTQRVTLRIIPSELYYKENQMQPEKPATRSTPRR